MVIFTSEWHENYAALEKFNKNQLIHFCIHVAKSVLYVWENRFPDDDRPKKAIEAAEFGCLSAGTAAWAASGRAYAVSAYKADAAARVAASAAKLAKRTEHSDAINAAVYVITASKLIHGNYHWLDKLYSSIHKEQPFPQSWKTRDTVSIAKDMLASKNLKDMPILADALEDAGCTDNELLSHLRYNKDLWTPVDWVLTNLGAFND